MGHIYGNKWALVFGKLVPFFAKSGVEDGRSRDFCYYVILIEFLWISYLIPRIIQPKSLNYSTLKKMLFEHRIKSPMPSI